MTVQEFKYKILQQGFQITEIGKYIQKDDDDKVGEFTIHARVDLRDTDSLNWYREMIIGADMYNTQEYLDVLKIAVTEIYSRYTARQNKNPLTCKHDQLIVLAGKTLCVECKAKIKGKVPINLQNKN